MSKTKIKRGASAAAAAAHINLSGVSFARLLNLGVIVRQTREVGYDLRVVRFARLNQLEALAAGRGGEDGGALLSTQRAKLAAAQANAAEFKNAQMMGDYMPLGVVKKQLETTFMVARERALSTPGKCADSLTPHCKEDREAIHEILRAEIYDMLEDMSDPVAYAAKIASKKASR